MTTSRILSLASALLFSASFASCKQNGGSEGPACGNGLLEAAETCEGEPVPTGCDPSSCTVQAGYVCMPDPPQGGGETDGGEPVPWTSTCVEEALCGDGVIGQGEECDDADTFADNGCDAQCKISEGWTCVGEPSDCSKCGDGFVDPDEECDSGIDLGNPSPGCQDCKVVEGWECSGEPTLCGPVCGDGMWFDTSVPDVTPGFAEQCDDGNLEDGDGCDADCRIEDGCDCEGTPPGTSTCDCSGPSTTGMATTTGDTGDTTGGTTGTTGG